jgi:arylsulfatase A-like enzyme
MRAGRLGAMGRRAVQGRRRRAPHGIARSVAVWVGLASVVLACGPDPRAVRARDPRPNVLLVSMDTTRADHLSAYGYARPTSSRLEAIAAEGVLVETAYAPSATTGPSHATLFTGLPPIAHDVRKNGQRLDSSHATLAERLAGAGYETGAVVSSYVLNRRFGYDQGFGRYDDDVSRADTPEATTLWEGQEIVGRFYGSADDTTRRALAWLDDRDHTERPFFLFVHYFDPHDPYLPPAGYRPPFAPTRRENLKLNRTIFLYDTLLAFTDREIGRLLDGLAARGLGDDTLVVVTGDHGEGLMAHGHMFHGVHVYEEAVRVPLILRWPGHLPPGRVVRTPFALVDLASTVLELIGEAGDGPLGPRGLAPRLVGAAAEPAPEPQPIFLYRRHYAGDEAPADGIEAVGEKFAVREGRWKLIEGPEEGTLELFDLERDPEERTNRAAEEPERTEHLRGLIADWRARHAGERGRAAGPTDEERARLRALGYVE